jgi:hypothetical protein
MNGYKPCTDGSFPTQTAAGMDSNFSGVKQATGATAQFDTMVMSTDKLFAVCYAEDGGSAAASWQDSGIRLTISKLKKLWFGTKLWSSSSGVREMTTTAHSRDILAQTANMTWTYLGELQSSKWLSLVDDTLNGGDPCIDAAIAGAPADSTHSGVLEALAGTKEVTIPQSTLLSATKTFAVCYAEDPALQYDGTLLDGSWRESYLRVTISKIESVSAHAVTHIVDGHIANVGSTKVSWDGALYSHMTSDVALLDITYTGSLQSDRFVSLVDHTFNNHFPCASGAVVAGTADSLHSGVAQGENSVVTYDTTGLNTTKTFAVCYTEGDGTAAATWIDTAIRLTVSEIKELQYGGPHETNFPVRTMYSTNVMAATNRLPQVQNIVVTYVGDLAGAKWLSLIDSTLNGANPCVNGTVAAAGEDILHSGAAQAASSTKVVTLPQSTLLDATKTFAICYAEADGSNTDLSWRDSYVRLTITQIHSLRMLTVSHFTFGTIANHNNTELTYTGSLASNKWVSLVDETFNAKFPCADGTVAAGVQDSQHSGATEGTNLSVLSVDTTVLSTSTTFAVCYTQGDGTTSASWVDTGIRLTVSLVTSISFGQPTRELHYWPHLLAICRLPATTNVVVSYAGVLSRNKWLSFVDSSLNGANPCVYTPVPNSTLDTGHSGPLQAAFSTNLVTIPDTTNMNVSATFTVCFSEVSPYSEVYSSSLPQVWQDSGIRLQFSQVASIIATQVTHETYGQIANHQALSVTYVGTLATNGWLSLVHQAVSNNLPCTDSSETAAGSTQASLGEEVMLDTSATDPNLLYAMCYSSDGMEWFDSAIRITTPRLITITYGYPARVISSDVRSTNKLPTAPAVVLAYSGQLESHSWISFVDASLNNQNPCVDTEEASHEPSVQHSGPTRASSGTKHVTNLNTESLWVTPLFALCYKDDSSLNAAKSLWADSYIRVTLSQIHTIVETGVPLSTIGSIGRGSIHHHHTGTLAGAYWATLVDETLNSNFPCAEGTVASGAASSNSVVAQGDSFGLATSVVSFDTSALSTTTGLAACYTEGDGTATSTWIDTGVRLMVSKITELHYGPLSSSFPVRIMGSSDTMAPTNRLPQVANTSFRPSTEEGGAIGPTGVAAPS